MQALNAGCSKADPHTNTDRGDYNTLLHSFASAQCNNVSIKTMQYSNKMCKA